MTRPTSPTGLRRSSSLPRISALIAAAAASVSFVSAQSETTEAGDPAPTATDEAAWPLTLDQALNLALAQNRSLERSRVDAEAARQDALSSWGAFDWTFSAQVRYDDAEREGSTQLAGGDVIETESARLDLDLVRPFSTGGRFEAHFDTTDSETTNSFFNSPSLVEDALRLSYIHPLLRGAGYEATTTQQRLAELDERRARESIRSARQTLFADVEAAYWDLVAALEQRDVSRSALDLGRRQLQQEEQRLRAGDGTEVDVLQARTEIATRTEALLRNDNDVSSAEDALRRLLLPNDDSATWSRLIDPVTPLPEIPAETPNARPTESGAGVSVEGGLLAPRWEDAWEVALAQRPELRQAELDLESARVRVQGARSDRLAGLDVQFNLESGANDQTFREATRDTFQFDFPSWSVILSYDLPLENRTAVHAEHAAKARLRSAKVAQEDQKLEVLADVRRAVRDVEYRAVAVRAAEESLDLAKRQLDAEQARFDAELSTTFKVLEFQQSWIEALSSAKAASAEYAKARSDLARAQGVAGEDPGAEE